MTQHPMRDEGRQAETATDTLIVSGARCTWWDDISKTGNSGPGRSGIPLCPHCRSPLFQQGPDAWWRNVDRYQADGHPGYRGLIEWMRGRCFRTMGDAWDAYEAQEESRG